jgi:hypothetical protein
VADVVASRELRALQEEVLSAQRDRPAAPPQPSAAPVEPPAESAEEHELRDRLRDLTGEVTGFFEDAEKSISSHPA